MMTIRVLALLLLAFGLSWTWSSRPSFAQSKDRLVLNRMDAEQEALKNSETLKSYIENTFAAKERSEAEYSALFPRLTLEGDYSYKTILPDIVVPNASVVFGAHDNYHIGPTLTYTLWDTFAARKNYQGYTKLTDSRTQDRRNEELRILYETRTDYVRVQALIAELISVNDSLELSRKRNSDIMARLRSGAATHLDQVESKRDVLSYEIQFAQKQAELSLAVQDLLARTRTEVVGDLTHPGPPGIPNVTLELHFESLQQSLEKQKDLQIPPPNDAHPRIQSLELSAQSAELLGEGTKAEVYPTLKLLLRTSLEYPNGPVPEEIIQNLFYVTLTMPLFEMNRTRHFAYEKMRQADSARFSKNQLRIDLQRDFGKSTEYLVSLRHQQKLAAQDILNSSESARLYYQQYKAGKVNLIDVQTAENRALLAKVNKARIDAQILNQVDQLRALSGKEVL